jgi:hypothetical protein
MGYRIIHSLLYTKQEKWAGLVKTGILKLRGMRKGSEKGRCPLCSEDEDAIHILLKCSETKKWREQFLSRKWLMLNEGTAYKKIINCTNITELRNIGIYLFNSNENGRIKSGIYHLNLGGGSRTVVIRKNMYSMK